GAAGVRSGMVSQFFVGSTQSTRPLFINLSVYAQDTWRVTPRLTLAYGMRWELNPPPSEANGNSPVTVRGLENLATLSLAPRGAPLYNTSYKNFAPRLGMSYQLLRRSGREMTLRGGIGIFYDIGNGQAGDAFVGFPYSTILLRGTNVSFPISPELAAPPSPVSRTPPFPSPGVTVFADDPNLKLPYTAHWNLAVEQSLGSNQTLSISYVAAAGRRLLQQRSIQNPNPNFLAINFTTNEATSDYHSLQVQYKRRLSRGVQALANYTWSHAIDKVSSDVTSFDLLRGAADFDVRHNFSGAITFNPPSPRARTFAGVILRNWSVDSIIRAQTATPFTVIASSFFNLDGILTNIRPNLITGAPLYLDDLGAPGGRRLNRDAFDTSPAESIPVRQGNLGRNTLRGFPLSQVDLALSRQFNLTERVNIQFRTEAFNLFNHPN
ncbi:MAG: TonB-dependent receptor, partial [Chloracidobacterium sp.]|nr:TonB-dependent receptor [Chloracidobacterium sp.]